MKTSVFIFFIITVCGCTLNQDIITLENRISLLEQRNARINKQLKLKIEENSKLLEKKEDDLREQAANQYVMINELRDEVQILNGKVEEINYNLKQEVTSANKTTENRLDRIEEIASSNKNRILKIERYLNLETSETDLKVKPEQKDEKLLSENELYALAKQAFEADDFQTARNFFQKLLKTYPESTHADNAQFWIGEIYYSEKWYEKAILEYQKVIEKYPKGNKVPASLLKQGFAFFSIGDKANARLILKELLKKYPESKEAEIAKKKLKGL